MNKDGTQLIPVLEEYARIAPAAPLSILKEFSEMEKLLGA